MMDKINGKVLTALLLIFFLSPIVIILFYFKIHLDIPVDSFIFAFKNSAIQSIITAGFCLLGSVLLVPGLSQIKNKWITSIMTAALLPSLLPSIFTILIVFSYFKNFPFGHTGIILIFVITYFGFSTVALSNAYNALVDRYSGVMVVYNVSWWDRYLKIYLPLLKQDLINIFLIIVLGCFSSLSVPLLAGGGRGANVELLIYESIYINGQWATASLVAIIQIILMLGLSFYLNQKATPGLTQMTSVVQKVKKVNLSLILFTLYIASYILGYIIQVIQSLIKVNFQQLYFNEFITALSNSLVLSIFSLALFLMLITTIIYLNYIKAQSQFITYFLLPSSTVVGFSLYLLFLEKSSITIEVLKVSLGLNLIYCLALYKSYIQPQFSSIQSQLDVCRIYGLSFATALKQVIIPQLKKSLVIGCNILFIFSFCEFALIKAAGSQSLFSGVFIERLISTYRLEQGFIYSFIVLCLVFLFFHITRFLSHESH
ncbi:MAG: ABC transporter permease subunit [Bdellovibrionaceae bacterium]|nr:ABC transporter permease subunit [Pseudobdellovibrionaceae bacterium]